MDRSHLFSWSLGVALMSPFVSPFAYILMLFLMPFAPWPPFGQPVFVSYTAVILVLIGFFGLVFRGNLKETLPSRAPSEMTPIHPRTNFLLFLGGVGYAVFVAVGFFSPFNLLGTGWLSPAFSVMLADMVYPFQFIIPALGGGSSPWPVLALLSYLALPDVVITYLLLRWRARVFAKVLGVLTAGYTLAFLGLFVVLAAAFA